MEQWNIKSEDKKASHLSSTNGLTLQVSVKNVTTSMWPENEEKRWQGGELDHGRH